MKKIITPLIIILVIAALGFFAFGKLKNAEYSPDSGTQATVSDKQGTTTKTGRITSDAGNFFLVEMGETPEMIDSMTVDLAEYVGQTVTIEGKYSGDTLFVGSVK